MVSRRHWCCIGIILVSVPAAQAQDVTFQRTWLCTNDSKEVAIDLTIGGAGLKIQGKTKNALPLEISYPAITRLSYGFTNHRRVAEALAGGMAALAVTSPLRHWLVIESKTGDTTRVTLLKLNQHEFRDVISALDSKSGKRVGLLDPKSTELDPTAGSQNVDEVVPFGMDRVRASLKASMESVGCTVNRQDASRMECHGRHINTDRTGFGGEIVTAELEPETQGQATRVRIRTAKPGLHSGRNWSAPIYRELRKQLGSPGA